MTCMTRALFQFLLIGDGRAVCRGPTGVMTFATLMFPYVPIPPALARCL